jgi:hypothetical protein
MSWVITGSEKTPVDLFRSQVSLLLHGDGTNGSTTITDSSPTPKTVTAVGNAQISTAQSKFGGASIAFDGNGDYLTFPHTNQLELGAGNFTIEFWAYINALSGTFTAIVGQWQAGANALQNSWYVAINAFNTTNKFGFTYTDGVVSTNLAFGDANTTGAWNHYAIVRSGNSLFAFKDGQLLNSGGTAIAVTINNGDRHANIGSLETGGFFNGYIDDLRITKGIARYTANFTPPTAPFPDI